MESANDWRVDNCRHIRGETLRRKIYKAPREDWDHDHCLACWAKFANASRMDALREGYATVAGSKWGVDYHWVCVGCFDELRDVMEWVEAV